MTVSKMHYVSGVFCIRRRQDCAFAGENAGILMRVLSAVSPGGRGSPGAVQKVRGIVGEMDFPPSRGNVGIIPGVPQRAPRPRKCVNSQSKAMFTQCEACRVRPQLF